MARSRIDFSLSPEFKALIEAWCESEGLSTQTFLHNLVAEALEWIEPEPPPKLKRASGLRPNKRAEAVQAAIDAARARRGVQ